MGEIPAELLGPTGALMLALIAIVGAIRGWWVPGWVHKETKTDRDEWKQMALASLSTAEKATAIAAKGAGTDAAA